MAIKGFGVFLRRVAFDAADSHHGEKNIFREPVAATLGFETFKNRVDLFATGGFIQGNEEIRVAQIAVVFYNLIFQDQVTPESVPC